MLATLCAKRCALCVFCRLPAARCQPSSFSPNTNRPIAPSRLFASAASCSPLAAACPLPAVLPPVSFRRQRHTDSAGACGTTGISGVLCTRVLAHRFGDQGTAAVDGQWAVHRLLGVLDILTRRDLRRIAMGAGRRGSGTRWRCCYRHDADNRQLAFGATGLTFDNHLPQ